ncbi:uncharacterized protein BCR38DRAFT_425299, partial [Pseudomassariella vexata]
MAYYVDHPGQEPASISLNEAGLLRPRPRPRQPQWLTEFAYHPDSYIRPDYVKPDPSMLPNPRLNSGEQLSEQKPCARMAEYTELLSKRAWRMTKEKACELFDLLSADEKRNLGYGLYQNPLERRNWPAELKRCKCCQHNDFHGVENEVYCYHCHANGRLHCRECMQYIRPDRGDRGASSDASSSIGFASSSSYHKDGLSSDAIRACIPFRSSTDVKFERGVSPSSTAQKQQQDHAPWAEEIWLLVWITIWMLCCCWTGFL